MRLVYVLLSPTFGMHQYTADLANRAAEGFQIENWEVHLVTTTALPRDRYSPAVCVHAPVTTRGTGFSPEGLNPGAYRRVLSTIQETAPCVVHITGVHLWNVVLVWALRRHAIPVIHTLHDLDPHRGVRFGGLIQVWNRLILSSGAHILVHGRRYRERLLAQGLPSERVTYVPLLHGFLGYEGSETEGTQVTQGTEGAVGSRPIVLFFGRVEPYKGVDILLAAWAQVAEQFPEARLTIAGARGRGVTLGALDRPISDPPLRVELLDQRIDDTEALALFRSASLLVLPYRDATQSALVAAAYAFGVPAIVTDVGALPEYVLPGETGWVVPAGDSAALAAVLREALANPDRLRRMGQAGLAWYLNQRQAEQTTLAAMYKTAVTDRL